jgi:hypothetical protein
MRPQGQDGLRLFLLLVLPLGFEEAFSALSSFGVCCLLLEIALFFLLPPQLLGSFSNTFDAIV